jgi:hypothetical protein
MNVRSPRFEQFLPDGTGGAKGVAASAEIDLASGDVFMSGGVSVSVPDEDVLIETEALAWKDDAKGLAGPENGAVLIKKGDGTYLSGIGFAADARSRSWYFTGTVNGTWVDSDEKTEAPVEATPQAIGDESEAELPDNAVVAGSPGEDPVPALVPSEADAAKSIGTSKNSAGGLEVLQREAAP